MAFQNCFTENQQTIKELLWKRKQIQGSEKQQVVPYISPAEQLPSTRKVCKKLQILIKGLNELKVELLINISYIHIYILYSSCKGFWNKDGVTGITI